jgi:hypothetical protein
MKTYQFSDNYYYYQWCLVDHVNPPLPLLCFVFLEGQYAHLQSISTQFHMSSSNVLYNIANKHNTECIFNMTAMLFYSAHKNTALQKLKTAQFTTLKQ